MNRSSGRFGFTRLIFASALVLAIHPSATPSGAQDPPAEDDASASLAGVDRSRWFADQQALQLRITGLRLEGKLKEAVALGNKAVTRSREFLGELDERTITALRNLAALYEEQENWPAARKILEEVRGLRERQPHRKDWQVDDARRAVADVDRRAAMTPAQRARWKEGLRLTSLAFKNSVQKNSQDELKNATEAERILRELLGEDHADYLSALEELASYYRSRVDVKHAEPLLRKRVDLIAKACGESHPEYAQALWALATFYDQGMRDYARAEPLYRQRVACMTRAYGYDDSHCLGALVELASLYARKGDSTHAEPVLRQLEAVLGPIYQKRRYYDAWIGAGIAHRLSRQVHGKDHPAYADSLTFLAHIHLALGGPARAEPYYLQALEIQKKALGETHPGYATGLNNLAEMYLAKGDYGRAEPLFQQALEIRKRALGETHLDYAASLHGLAGLFKAKADYGRAELLYQQALEIRKKAFGEDHPDYATTLDGLAMLYLAEGDSSRAEPLLRRALELRYRAFGVGHPDYATSVTNLASLYREKGDYGRAEPLCQQALEVRKRRERVGHPEEYAESLTLQAAIRTAHGSYARAEPLYSQALVILKRVRGQDHPSYAAILNKLAELYLAKGDYGRAEPLYQQSLEIRKKVLGQDHPDYAASLNGLAGLYKAKADYSRAESLYQQALEIRRRALGEAHPDYAASLTNLAMLYQALGDYRRAEPLYHQSLDIRKKAFGQAHPAYAAGLTNLAELYLAEGDRDHAGRLFSESLEKRALFLRTTLAGLDERQRLRLLAAQRAALDMLITVTPPDGPGIADLYGHVLDWKGAADAFQAEDHLTLDHPELRPTLDRLAALRASLGRLAFVAPTEPQRATLQTQLERLLEAKETTEADLARRSADFRRRERAQKQGPEELAAALPGEAALVDFFVYTHAHPTAADKGPFRGELRLIAFVVRRGQPVVLVPLGSTRPIDVAVAAWRQAVEKRQASARDTASAELDRRVWNPLRPHLGNPRSVIVVPDGRLSAFPFAALPGRMPGSYLIEDLAISYVASGRQAATAFADPSGPPGRGLLAAGGIDFQADPGRSGPSDRHAPAPAIVQRSGFAPLPATGAEARAARDLFHNAFADQPAVLLTGIEPTEAELKRRLDGGHLRVVHLATHGFFESPDRIAALRAEIRRENASAAFAQAGKDEENPLFELTPMLRSGVVLAGGSRAPDPATINPPPGVAVIRDDGILTAEEVQGLDLRGTELVVLSACETGLGAIEAGQGVLGLQRAFRSAGAETVVASLWKVDDAATAVLMERFYTNLWTKKLSTLEALRQAQLEILKNPTLVDVRRAQITKRGIESVAEPLPGGGTADTPSPGVARRGDPALWAAFLLSGDGGTTPAGNR